MDVKLRRASRTDAEWVFTHLRAEDYTEVTDAADGADPYPILMAGWKESRVCYALRVNGRAIAVLGILPTPSFNVVWLVATDEVAKHRLAVLRHGRDVADKWFRRFGTLMCIADNRNTLHQRWIKLIGFEEGMAVPSLPFTRFLYRARR